MQIVTFVSKQNFHLKVILSIHVPINVDITRYDEIYLTLAKPILAGYYARLINDSHCLMRISISTQMPR